MKHLKRVYWVFDPMIDAPASCGQSIKTFDMFDRLVNTIVESNLFDWVNLALLNPLKSPESDIEIHYINPECIYSALERTQKLDFLDRCYRYRLLKDEDLTSGTLESRTVKFQNAFLFEFRIIIRCQLERMMRVDGLEEDKKEERRKLINFKSLQKWVEEDEKDWSQWFDRDDLVR
ncbi:hypothetical protein L486_03313 [Kwoniella mangroviensis CBS 10435]|uniref:Uncharacterized protein n=1 Tax=Kwoniella mangroviensis CBS 10435 TaxID=1331196 RepID=A0A1B9ITG6_9TREE|nr:hypothetical protein L486_03313 [Kwoniella mangroviensis CBS 10435]